MNPCKTDYWRLPIKKTRNYFDIEVVLGACHGYKGHSEITEYQSTRFQVISIYQCTMDGTQGPSFNTVYQLWVFSSDKTDVKPFYFLYVSSYNDKNTFISKWCRALAVAVRRFN